MACKCRRRRRWQTFSVTDSAKLCRQKPHFVELQVNHIRWRDFISMLRQVEWINPTNGCNLAKSAPSPSCRWHLLVALMQYELMCQKKVVVHALSFFRPNLNNGNRKYDRHPSTKTFILLTHHCSIYSVLNVLCCLINAQNCIYLSI